MKKTPLEKAIDQYIFFLESDENKSPLTVRSYHESLKLFASLSTVENPLDIDKLTVRKYKASLHAHRKKNGKRLTVRTKNHHLTVLKVFLKFLSHEAELDVYSADKITLFKEEERQIKYLQAEEVKRLIDAPDETTKIGKRDRAILSLFFSTGTRKEELRSLNRKDVNFKTCEISVRGKRGKIRVVFISETAAEAIEKYLAIRFDHLTPLFIRNLDKAVGKLPPGENYRISRSSIDSIVKKYAAKAGLVTDPSAHTLRHSFATDLLHNGADLRTVQEMLGHEVLESTKIYTHITNPQLKEAHQKYHDKQK